MNLQYPMRPYNMQANISENIENRENESEIIMPSENSEIITTNGNENISQFLFPNEIYEAQNDFREDTIW